MEPAIPSYRITRWQQPFFSVWIGQAFSLLGSSLAGFALVWWLTITTASAKILAVGTLIIMAPISNFMTIPAMSFFPLIVTQFFGMGIQEVGWMSIAQGTGLLAGGFATHYFRLLHTHFDQAAQAEQAA